MYSLEQLQQKNIKELKEIGWQLNVMPEGDKRCRQNWIDALVCVNPPLLQLLEVSPVASVEQVQELIIETVETSSGVELEQAQEQPIESKFGRIVYPRPVQEAIAQAVKNPPVPAVETSPGVKVKQAQEPIEYGRVTGYLCRSNSLIVPVAETSSGVEQVLTERFDVEEFRQTYAAEIERYIKSFTEGDRPPNRGDNGRDRLESEAEVSQSAIAQMVKNPPGVESENPILTGIALSDRFCARYSPPQSESIHYRTHLGSISFANRLSISLMKYKLSFAVGLVRVCSKFLTKLLCKTYLNLSKAIFR